jgi:DNA-binding CsgD family transcriptional regulator
MLTDARNGLAPDQSDLLLELLELPAAAPTATMAMLETASARLAEVLGDASVVSLVSRDGRSLQPRAVSGADPKASELLEPLLGRRLGVDRGFTRHVLATGTALRLPETSPEVLAVGRPELASYGRRFGIRSLLVAPIRAAGRPIGHVTMLRGRSGAPYTAADEQLVQGVADVIGLAVRAAGAREPAPPAAEGAGPGRSSLTVREREILGLLGLGYTNREVAARLHLSVRTVEWHRGRLQWKLGVRGRAALQRFARSEGLLDLRPQ